MSLRFRPGDLRKLIDGFQADAKAQSRAKARDYIHNYGAGGSVRQLELFWPQYVCALENDSGEGFSSCVCGMKP